MVNKLDTQDYPQFVAGLFKDMGNETLNAFHAVTGLTGEAGEVLDLAKKNWIYGKKVDAELMEELGDFRFYLQALINMFEGYGFEYTVPKHPDGELRSEASHTLMLATGQLHREATEIFSVVFLQWSDFQELEAAQIYLLRERVRKICRLYENLIHFCIGGFDQREQIILINMEKLSKRYPGGVFDAEAAIARADKA